MRTLFESVVARVLSRARTRSRIASAELDQVVKAIRPEFDCNWYIEQYPGSTDGGLDPVLHYVLAGAELGFDPHPRFSTRQYLARNDDVRSSGMNPYYHWLSFGRGEGRDPGSDEAPGRPVAQSSGNAMFSVFLCCSGHAPEHIAASIDSLARQSYRNFEVILLGHDDAGHAGSFPVSSRGLFCEAHKGPADVLRRGGENCWRGDYLMMIAAGDTLEAHALAALSVAAAQDEECAEVLLCDHATGTARTRRKAPGLDPDLLAHFDYLSSGIAVSKPAVLRATATSSHDSLYSLALAIAEGGASWRHVTEPLLRTNAEPTPASFTMSGRRAAAGVSIIIPNRDRPDLLRACTHFLEGLRDPFQLIIVDNGSTDPDTEILYNQLETKFGAVVLRVDHAFNYSRMVNAGAAVAKQEFLLLLNNDVVITDPLVVVTALDYAARPGVGVVGSVLRYPDGGVQHAGMVFWLAPDGSIGSDHVFRHARETDDAADMLWALSAPRGWQAVTGAFQVVRRSVYAAVGGYDECNLPIEYNDVDFCFRIRALGMRVVCLPLPGIIHDESSTRRGIGADTNRSMRRAAHLVMKARWLPNFRHDPFLHPEVRRAMGVKTHTDHQKLEAARIGSLQGQARGLPVYQRGTAPDARGPRQLAPGICILGYLNSEIGLGESARNFGRACDAARLPASYVNRPLFKRSNEPVIESFFQPRADRRVTIRIEGLTVDGYNLNDEGMGRIQLLYVFWELPRIPDGARAMLDQYDEIWAGSEFIATALREAVRKPVRVVRQPLDVPAFLRDVQTSSDRFRFLTYFDFDSHLARKNPMAAIFAFRAAFPERKDVQLVVKARGIANAEARRVIAETIGDDRRIRLIDATLSRCQMTSLMNDCDAFISLHRAEGFGFGAAEAFAAGKAVIATDWSATSEFVTPETGFPVAYRLRPVNKSEYVCSENQIWADPLVDSAVEQLRAVADNPDAARARARKGHALLLENNSFTVVGARIATALGELGAL
jgi:GT2 family glycosyltransferase/glycosyltransferase involved in cell wall biosynthesis